MALIQNTRGADKLLKINELFIFFSDQICPFSPEIPKINNAKKVNLRSLLLIGIGC